MIFVLVPFDNDSKGAVLENLSSSEINHMEFDSIILVSYQKTASELNDSLNISESETSCMIVGMGQLSGYGPAKLKDWIETYNA